MSSDSTSIPIDWNNTPSRNYVRFISKNYNSNKQNKTKMNSKKPIIFLFLFLLQIYFPFA